MEGKILRRIIRFLCNGINSPLDEEKLIVYELYLLLLIMEQFDEINKKNNEEACLPRITKG